MPRSTGHGSLSKTDPELAHVDMDQKRAQLSRHLTHLTQSGEGDLWRLQTGRLEGYAANVPASVYRLRGVPVSRPSDYFSSCRGDFDPLHGSASAVQEAATCSRSIRRETDLG